MIDNIPVRSPLYLGTSTRIPGYPGYPGMPPPAFLFTFATMPGRSLNAVGLNVPPPSELDLA
eukprot:1618128-Rhodomonas_salina.1